jgi:hypothetical protein
VVPGIVVVCAFPVVLTQFGVVLVVETVGAAGWWPGLLVVVLVGVLAGVVDRPAGLWAGAPVALVEVAALVAVVDVVEPPPCCWVDVVVPAVPVGSLVVVVPAPVVDEPCWADASWVACDARVVPLVGVFFLEPPQPVSATAATTTTSQLVVR